MFPYNNRTCILTFLSHFRSFTNNVRFSCPSSALCVNRLKEIIRGELSLYLYEQTYLKQPSSLCTLCLVSIAAAGYGFNSINRFFGKSPNQTTPNDEKRSTQIQIKPAIVWVPLGQNFGPIGLQTHDPETWDPNPCTKLIPFHSLICVVQLKAIQTKPKCIIQDFK